MLLVFVAWQIAQCLRRVALNIRRACRLVIGEMDYDELIDELMSVADLQGAGAGLAEGAPPAAAPAVTPDLLQEDEGCKKTANGSLPSRREAKPGSSDWWSVGKHSLPIKSTLWTIAKLRSFMPASKQGLGQRWWRRWGLLHSSFMRGSWPCFSRSKTSQGSSQTSRATRLSDPISSATCEHYHCYSMFLAPLTAALTTLKHCQLGHCCPVRVHDGGDEAGEQRDGRGASTESSSGKSYGES